MAHTYASFLLHVVSPDSALGGVGVCVCMCVLPLLVFQEKKCLFLQDVQSKLSSLITVQWKVPSQSQRGRVEERGSSVPLRPVVHGNCKAQQSRDGDEMNVRNK